MLRVMLKQQLDDKEFRDRRKITLNEVSQETGVSRPTLTRIANVPGYNTNTDTLNALCKYFGCTPGDLLKYVDE